MSRGSTQRSRRARYGLRAGALLDAAGLVLTACTEPDGGGLQPVEPHPEVAAAEAASAGVVVRPFAGEGIRVSVGEPEATDLFCEIAAGWREGV